MNDIGLIEAFKRFTNRDETRAIREVAIRDGVVYASDGRIGLAGKLKASFPDSVPDKFPFANLKEIVEVANTVPKFWALNQHDFTLCDGEFIERLDKQRLDDIREHRARYTEFSCPCCGDTLYWDNNEEEVVRAKSDLKATESRDVEISTRIHFPEKRSALVNFCYLHMLLQNLNGMGIAFGLGKDDKILYFRSADGGVYGALMTLHEPNRGYPANFNVFIAGEPVEVK